MTTSTRRKMTAMLATIIITTTMALLIVGSAAYGEANDRVRLQDVQALTLRAGGYTSGRRSSPVPQMSCVGGSARCPAHALPSIMQCTNQGWNGRDVQWKCEAQLSQEYKLVETTVTCEGYEYPDDPYILAGSCGVEYTMDTTGYRANTNNYQQPHYQYTRPHYSYESNDSWFGSVVSMLFFLGIGWVIYKICSGSNNRNYPNVAPGFGAGAGAGFGTGAGYGNGYPPTGYPTNTGPGFWSGLGLGGLLGNGFGGGWGRRQGWGWGNNYNTGYGNTYGAGYGGAGYTAPSGFSSAPSSSSAAAPTSTSTGYGGTKRR